MRLLLAALLALTFSSTGLLRAQQVYLPPPLDKIPPGRRDSIPRPPWTMPLYEGAIPNSKGAPDEERQGTFLVWPVVEKVSRPTMTAYLPAADKSMGSAVIIFPGGGYVGEALAIECNTVAEALQNRGVAAFVVKYRLPSPVTMVDQAIGPLQDAQQAIRLVREHASDWSIDPVKVGVMGFSAGGHLAASAGTHYSRAYAPNDNNVNLRPDFMILVYPLISMMSGLGDPGSRTALLGAHPSDERVRLFSNELQVTDTTPPTMLLHAADDRTVDVDNSVQFFEALRHHRVPVEMIIFPQGGHGMFPLPRDEWLQPTFEWMIRNGWMKP
jgi:acetyl esterase/lipase